MAEVDSIHAVNKMLAALRQGKMGWIADEVESVIQGGKLVDQAERELSTHFSLKGLEFSGRGNNLKKKKKEKLLEVEPLTEIEKLKITLRTIQHYVVGLEKTWSSAQTGIQECLDQNNMKVVITDVFTTEEIPIFEQNFTNLCEKIDSLLDEAWPEGNEPYDLLEYNYKEIKR